MPNGVACVYPASGAVVMLPLTPANKYTPTVLFCGGFDMPADYHGNYSWPFYVSLQNLRMALRRHTNRTTTCSRAVPWVSSLPSLTRPCLSSTVLRTAPLGSLTRLSTPFSRPDTLFTSPSLRVPSVRLPFTTPTHPRVPAGPMRGPTRRALRGCTIHPC